MRGAWIEMVGDSENVPQDGRSLPVRGAWIEILLPEPGKPGRRLSLPVRGAWIEITIAMRVLAHTFVAPCEGSVD